MLKYDVKKELELLTKLLRENDVKCSDTVMGRLHDEMRTAKAEIDDILGLNEANNYRKYVPVIMPETEFRDRNKKVSNIICKFLSKKLQISSKDISFTQNTVRVKKNTLKLSRQLTKSLDEVWKLVEPIQSELQNQLTFKMTKENFVTIFATLSKSGDATISTNITDFILSTNSSCYKIGGCHFNGNIAYARDNITVLTYRERSKDVSPTPNDLCKYRGRAWNYILPKHGQIIETKTYGDFHGPFRLAIRRYIEAMMSKKCTNLGKKWVVVPRSGYPEYDSSIVGSGRHGSHSSYPIYFDETSGVVVCMNADALVKRITGASAAKIEVHDTIMEVKKDEHFLAQYPKLDFKKATCLRCGVETLTNTGGYCRSDCKGLEICGVCGKEYRETSGDVKAKHHKHVCPDCINSKFKFCDHCNTYILVDGKNAGKLYDVSEYSKAHTYVCESCYKCYYTVCDSCGKSADNISDLTHTDDHKYCDSCFHIFKAENAVYSCSCGEHHRIDTICPNNGVMLVTPESRELLLKDIASDPEIMKLVKKPTPRKLLELTTNDLEKFFAAKLMTELIDPKESLKFLEEYAGSVTTTPATEAPSTDVVEL